MCNQTVLGFNYCTVLFPTVHCIMWLLLHLQCYWRRHSNIFWGETGQVVKTLVCEVTWTDGLRLFLSHKIKQTVSKSKSLWGALGRSCNRADRADFKQDFVWFLLHIFSTCFRTLVLFNMDTCHYYNKWIPKNTNNHNMTPLNTELLL